jgi:hypothetical protein
MATPAQKQLTLSVLDAFGEDDRVELIDGELLRGRLDTKGELACRAGQPSLATGRARLPVG